VCQTEYSGGEGGKRCVGMPLETRFGGKWLCSIIRIYTHSALYTIFLAVTLRATKSGRAGKICLSGADSSGVSSAYRPNLFAYMRTFLLILKKKYFFQIFVAVEHWPAMGWGEYYDGFEGIAYRRRAKASTVGSESSGCRLSPPFAAICRLIDGGRGGETRGVPACPVGGVVNSPPFVDIKVKLRSGGRSPSSRIRMRARRR